jgi:hypothetical protein
VSEADDSGQQLITEYPTVDDHDEPEPDLDGYETVRFDIFDPDGSLHRAREQQTDIEIVADGYHVSLEDGDHDHLVVLYRDEDGWQADYWNLNDDGERTGRWRLGPPRRPMRPSVGRPFSHRPAAPRRRRRTPRPARRASDGRRRLPTRRARAMTAAPRTHARLAGSPQGGE